MENSRFPNKLISFRRSKGLSRKKVARALGYADTSVISKWERGLVNPGLIQAFQLAKIYGVVPTVLFEEIWLQVDSDESLLISSEMFISNSCTSMCN